jgi:hypothetical protein
VVEMKMKGLVDTHLVLGVAVESAKALPQKKIERVEAGCRLKCGCLTKLILV